MAKPDKEPKPINYACVPARAFRDRRLALCDLRVLGAIASHDRLGKNGMGCYASREQLSRESACVKSVVTRSRKKLVRLGYVREENRGSRRRIQYFVVHDTADSTAQPDISGQNGMQKSDSPQSFSAPKNVQKSDRSATPQMQKSDRSATHNIYSEAPHPKDATADASDDAPRRRGPGCSSAVVGGASSLRSSLEEIPRSCVGEKNSPTRSLEELRQQAQDSTLTLDDIPTDTGVLQAYTARIEREDHYTETDYQLLAHFVEAAEAVTDDMQVIGHILRVCDEYEDAFTDDGDPEDDETPDAVPSLWTAVIEACGCAGLTPTAVERGGWNKAVKELQDVGATADEVHRRARNYRAIFPQATLTPMALARQWSMCAKSKTDGATIPRGVFV